MNKIIVTPNWVYIEPITVCNLKCRMCYTNARDKKWRILSRQTILSFVDKFLQTMKELTIFWCGTGEVFLYPRFPELINELNRKYGKRISHYIQTNATMIVALARIERFDNIRILASIDAPREHHDWNRGKDAYDRAVEFCRLAASRGARRIYIKCLVTKDNIKKLEQAKKQLYQDIGYSQRMRFYILKTFSNKDIEGVKGLGPIPDDSKVMNANRLERILNKIYKNKFQEMWGDEAGLEISLLPDGKLYNCCEGIVQIGMPSNDPKKILKKIRRSKDLCEKQCDFYKDCFSD